MSTTIYGYGKINVTYNRRNLQEIIEQFSDIETKLPTPKQQIPCICTWFNAQKL